jgi:hypothetical protein
MPKVRSDGLASQVQTESPAMHGFDFLGSGMALARLTNRSIPGRRPRNRHHVQFGHYRDIIGSSFANFAALVLILLPELTRAANRPPLAISADGGHFLSPRRLAFRRLIHLLPKIRVIAKQSAL